LDMIQIPYWDGNPAHPYPSVKVRMDFRGPDIGDFVYHCHILGHEDNGMMAVIRVLPAATSKQSTATPKATASIRTNDSTSAPAAIPASATETIDRTPMPSWTELDMLK
ncbi:MAG TPA: multicopper oxidase domain-containing protein, partial [Candidatus Acidoferrum sp.]|nr:multicopper oxidase domain-containing protein [Candidatus Acidoferrum sp.]